MNFKDSGFGSVQFGWFERFVNINKWDNKKPSSYKIFKILEPTSLQTSFEVRIVKQMRKIRSKSLRYTQMIFRWFSQTYFHGVLSRYKDFHYTPTKLQNFFMDEVPPRPNVIRKA